MATEQSSSGLMQDAPDGRLRNFLIFGAIGVFAAIVFGLLYLFVIAPAAPGSSLGWFLFSFATGITMIIMPCTLPLAFVIVPLSMGKGLIKGISMALAFGLGVAVTQSMYGVIAALLGGVAINALGADLESVKNWVYLIAGTFALLFALGEIGLVKFRMPTYTGAAPAFIQQRKDALKAFLLGLFLGNVGVGCPHPATPLLLIEAASSGNVIYGWLLFLIHSIGRILPLLLLAFLGILGVNGLGWLVSKKDIVERVAGWAMVFVAGFILTLGLFTHDWWVNSGIHSALEKLTQESYFNAWFNNALGTDVAHVHGLEEGTGMFGLPLALGHWFLVSLWLIPIWWWWFKRRGTLLSSPALRIQALERRIDALEQERRQIESIVNLDDVEVDLDLKKHQEEIDRLEKMRRSEENKVQFAEKGALASPIARGYEVKILYATRNYLLVLSVFIVLVFAYFLPTNFYLASMAGIGHGDHGGGAHEASSTMSSMMQNMGTPFSTSPVGIPDAQEPETVTLKDGDTYTITAGYVKKEVGNRLLRMLAYNRSVPGPFIKAPQGSTVRIHFLNNTDIEQTIHSHGVRVHNLSDGVPGVTQHAVQPGESYTYTINFADAGVYWFHPHTRDDYGQEMGLYGNYIVEPSDPLYWSPVNRELPLVLDDILIENDRIAPFYREFTDHALLGRFGNEFLVNGEQNYALSLGVGEVVRFMITNVSNARTYNLSIPGARIKMVGSDVGKYEKEYTTDSFLLSPAERAVIEVYFEKPGAYTLEHTTPEDAATLATFVVDRARVTKETFLPEFEKLRTNVADEELFGIARTYLSQPPAKRIGMSVDLGMMNASADHSGHAHAADTNATSHDHTSAATPSVDHSSHAHTEAGNQGIQWNDSGNTDAVNTNHHTVWKLTDLDTGKINTDIHWVFKQGSFVKVSFYNDPAAAHVMQHPIHFHGQRFVVLATDGVPNQNLVWKDTALVLPGQTVDVLVDMSNPGEWMAHCHIVEHLHSGMILLFRVEDASGKAPGDEWRSSLSQGAPANQHQHGSMTASAPETLGMATSDMSFGMTIPPTNYSAIPEKKFARVGRLEEVSFELVDRSGTSIQLTDTQQHPLTVTFVKSDDRLKILTYPGNAAMMPVTPITPPQATPPQSDGHDHIHMLPMLIRTAHAHGGVPDGHPDATTESFIYTVPVLFPEKGVYRAFVEFVPIGGSEVRMAAFDIEVGSSGWSFDNYGWSKEEKWWILLIVSICIMIPLCVGVRRYIGKDN